MRYFIKLFLLCLNAIPLISHGQHAFSVRTAEAGSLPKGIRYEGRLKTAVLWKDSLGDNVVITSETGVYRSKKFKHENDGSDAELFAIHYLIQGDSAVKNWKVYDFISDCPVDIEAAFLKNTFRITDLNHNGIAEIWLMYKTVCHGDVSPCDMKIIMYEGKQKFAMRGQNRVLEGKDSAGIMHYLGGEYTIDRAFATGPPEFLAYAKTLWEENMMQRWSEE